VVQQQAALALSQQLLPPLEKALAQFTALPLERVRTHCAGRTDTGVHAVNQVVHLDAAVEREPFSWVRGTNRYLPDDVAVQWCVPVDAAFHARNSARGRRYRYLLRESAARPALDQGLVGWSFRPLDGDAMRAAAAMRVAALRLIRRSGAACAMRSSPSRRRSTVRPDPRAPSRTPRRRHRRSSSARCVRARSRPRST
jgi:tRNA pseudouridine38-40 synthase